MSKKEKTYNSKPVETEDYTSQKDFHYQRHERGDITWGVFLIFAGLVFLLNSMGVIPWHVWNELWKFWPVLLIFAGINIIFGSNPISRLILIFLAVWVMGLVFLISIDKTSPEFINRFPQEIQNTVNYWEEVLNL